MFGMGPMELGIILVIVVVLFGARRLPEIGAGFGKAIKNFKAGVSGDEIDVTPGELLRLLELDEHTRMLPYAIHQNLALELRTHPDAAVSAGWAKLPSTLSR